jgi:hypothetical protein
MELFALAMQVSAVSAGWWPGLRSSAPMSSSSPSTTPSSPPTTWYRLRFSRSVTRVVTLDLLVTLWVLVDLGMDADGDFRSVLRLLRFGTSGSFSVG